MPSSQPYEKYGMTEYMHLTGTEAVTNAARTMRDAAESMQRTQGWWAEMLQAHERRMFEWLEEYKSLLAAQEKKV